MFNLGDIIATLKLDTSALAKGQQAFQQFGDKVQGIGNGINKSMQAAKEGSDVLLAGVTVVSAAAVGFGALSLKAYADHQSAVTQTQAVLKSTGAVAGWTADQVQKLSDKLQSQTQYSQDDVRAVQNMLLTFTAIKGDVMPQATEAVLNMSTALGENSKDAAIQLGKALQDPILGATALRRVGVALTKQQQEQIKTLVATGQSAKAQQIILKELNNEFGGSAKAAGTTLAGALARLKNSFTDVQISVGQTLNRYVGPFVNGMLDWFDSIGGVNGVLQRLGKMFDMIQPYLPIIISALLFGLIPALWGAAGGFIAMMAPLLPFLIIGAAVGGLIKLLVDYLGGWKEALNDVSVVWGLLVQTFTDGDPTITGSQRKFAGFASFLANTVQPVFDDIKDVVRGLWLTFTDGDPTMIASNIKLRGFSLFLLNTVQPAFDNLKSAIAGVWRFIQANFVPALQTLWSIITQVWGAAVQLATILINTLGPPLLALFNTVATQLLPALANLFGALMQVWKVAGPVLVPVLEALAKLIAGVVVIALWLIINVLNIVVQALSGAINWFANFLKALADLGKKVTNFFSDILRGNILKAVADFGDLLFTAGKDLIQGLLNGIGSLSGGVGKTISNIGSDAVKGLKGLLGIHSPSTVFAEIGGNIGQGLVQGLNSSAKAVKSAMTNVVPNPTANGAPLTSVTNNSSNQNASNQVSNYYIQNQNFNTKEAVDEIFSVTNRNIKLESMGGAPLPGTVGARV